MAPTESRNRGRRQRILSISCDPVQADWVDALVQLLKEHGYPKATRSEIIRVGLTELRDALQGRHASDIVKLFVRHDTERLLAVIDASAPRLPFG